MARSDFQAVFRVGEAEGIEGGVVILERLALAHGNQVGHAIAEVFLHSVDLADHLCGRKVARKAFVPGSAEGARHCASCLRGKADGEVLRLVLAFLFAS